MTTLHVRAHTTTTATAVTVATAATAANTEVVVLTVVVAAAAVVNHERSEHLFTRAHQSVAPDARGSRWGFAHRRLPLPDLAPAGILSCATAGHARPFLRA